MNRYLFVVVGLLLAAQSRAAVKSQEVSYEYEGTKLKGYLYWDDAVKGKRPGVLVVHEFWGLDAYAKKRAEMLAELGYVAFAADMYGEGKLTEHPNEAGAMAGEVRKNIKMWQGRAQAGLKILKANEHCDGSKLAAIGYCFGGSTALQLAYSSPDVTAVVTFHAALPIPTEEQAKAIKAKILICHGAEDTFIPEDVCTKFRAALTNAGVDYAMHYYGGAVHSFTVPEADKKGLKGIKYDANADKRSWREMQSLFNEVFATKK
jgi:dienelactone hydrolase